ncbi:hypothetical protein HPB50_014961 [Hyalomma asiaticum]|uniref:Uncharacterized protein n=1 Tax=Hyalomma asiaticum TaxID=266040 RepID=A0ACB7S356_HYAAI|nr:hypothetical protein HPB50_014961 [Hyalomma asiaticum]
MRRRPSPLSWALSPTKGRDALALPLLSTLLLPSGVKHVLHIHYGEEVQPMFLQFAQLDSSSGTTSDDDDDYDEPF